MQCYCQCGFKVVYAGVKPKKCPSCDELLEPPALPRREKAAKPPRYVEAEEEPADEIPIEEQYVLDPKSFRFEKYEGGFMTIGQLRKDGGGFAERGGRSAEIEQVKDQVIGQMLDPKSVKQPERVPVETKPRSAVRRMPSRLAPPA